MLRFYIFFASLTGLLTQIGCSDTSSSHADLKAGLVTADSFAAASSSFESEPWRRDTPITDSLPGRDIDRALLNSSFATPEGYRKSMSLADNSWLTAELYSRRSNAKVSDFLSVVPNPDDPERSVIRLASLEHTDGVVFRSSEPLPDEYRISLRIGHIQYGGTDKLNGYDSGGETGEPWMNIPAVGHNGVYWATIMDTRPEPNSNVWSHHHRKFFIDAWNYRKRMLGVTVAAVNGESSTDPRVGKAFIAHDGHQWKPNSIEPAFFYLPKRWYQVTIERSRGSFRYSVEGEFHGIGFHRFEDSLDIKSSCVYHFNRSADELDESCLNGDVLEGDLELVEVWPAGSGYADYFMMGDPHTNFYEGSVLLDQLRLEPL